MRATLLIIAFVFLCGAATYCTSEVPKATACKALGYHWVTADSSCWTPDGRRSFPWEE